MRSGRKIQRALRKFAADWGDFSGSERSEARTYLNELIGCYGVDRRSVGARFEGSHTAHGIIDMYWPGVCVVEMKEPSQANKLADHSKQALEYWDSSDDSRFVVLCAFQRFEVWERERFRFGRRGDFTLDELPENYEKLIFLAGLDQASRMSLFLKLAAVVFALGVCAVGILLLWGVWDGRPVAAAFTRVGGATRVETALEASRFWLTPPWFVVETQTDASQQIMLGAAQCAMAYDAPLLFTSSDPTRQQLVNATINDWRKIETPEGPARPEVIPIHSQRPIWQVTLPEVIPIQNQPEVNNCLASGGPAGVAGLSTLEVPNPLIRLPQAQVPAQQTLAHVVVFAAAIEPGDPPDVAVGLALAAHMARANREKVSLVVVPHYLESDLELEDKLEGQHELVTGGVVLGETPTVPEDTRVLLRQLLTSRDRQGVFAQVQANLGSVGSLIAALLALVGLAAASRIAGPIVIERLERAERERIEKKPTGTGPTGTGPTGTGQRISVYIRVKLRIGAPVTKESDWLIALGKDRKVTVTIWLRSGRQVTGTIECQFPDNARDATVFRIKNASLVTNGANPSQSVSLPGAEGKCVLVSVKDIELIDINDSKPEPAKAGQTSAGRAEIRTGGQEQDRPAGEP